jgi:peptidoglycan/xylan/chitin deacetylase (PgdA/CDA1 family)
MRRVGPVVALLAVLALVAVAFTTSGSGRGGGSGGPGRQVAAAKRHPEAGRQRRQAHARDRLRRRARPGVDALAVASVLRYTPFVSRGIPRHRIIALTFDDGPSPYTQPIVQILVRMHVPATFFVVGQQLNDFADGLRDEIANGFVIGDHTENHAWLIRLGTAGQYGQIHDAGLRIRHLGARFPDLFRPPYGAYDTATLRLLHRLGMLMVMWSIDPGDWRRPGTGWIISDVVANASPGGIVELHDGGGDRSQTVAALPVIIRDLRRRGYRFVTIPQLLALDPPPHHQPLPHLAGV